jgi:hypothetical protein
MLMGLVALTSTLPGCRVVSSLLNSEASGHRRLLALPVQDGMIRDTCSRSVCCG